jgi:hypothetical protein
MRLRGLSKSARGHFSSPLRSASTPVFSVDLAYLTTLLFSSIYIKSYRRPCYRKKHLLNGKEKISDQLEKKPRWSETRVKPCFGQQMTPVFRPAEIEINHTKLPEILNSNTAAHTDGFHI